MPGDNGRLFVVAAAAARPLTVGPVGRAHELLLGLTVAESVQIAAAGFAALGAAAAWRSAGLNYRSQLASSRPELAARGLNYGDVKVVHFEVDNYGGGLARGAGFLFIEGDQYVGDFLGTGTLRAGERLRVYVHLMDAGLGGADFLDGAVGTTWATEDPGKAVRKPSCARPKAASSRVVRPRSRRPEPQRLACWSRPHFARP